MKYRSQARPGIPSSPAQIVFGISPRKATSPNPVIPGKLENINKKPGTIIFERIKYRSHARPGIPSSPAQIVFGIVLGVSLTTCTSANSGSRPSPKPKSVPKPSRSGATYLVATGATSGNLNRLEEQAPHQVQVLAGRLTCKPPHPQYTPPAQYQTYKRGQDY